MSKLLEGLRVVDFSQYIPGPYATLLLAQLGAEVVKVERPGGESMRSVGPMDSDGVSAFYKTVNGDKSIVELNLKDARDRATFDVLLEHADVLVESFRPGVVERLGFGPEDLRKRYPRLIVCSISGFGQNGPYRLRPGHDINYLAFSGMLAGTGTSDTPVAPSPPVSDYASGIQAVATVLAAVVSRYKTNQGVYVDVGMADTVLAWQSSALSNLTRKGYPLERGEGVETGAMADYGIYRTADARFITLGAQEPHFWENFCNAVNRPEWIDRHRDPVPQRDLIAEVAALFAAQPLAHWRRVLDDAECCFEAVWEHGELADHPQVSARKMVRREDWPDALMQTSFPAWIDGEPPASSNPPRYTSGSEVAEKWRRANEPAC